MILGLFGNKNTNNWKKRKEKKRKKCKFTSMWVHLPLSRTLLGLFHLKLKYGWRGGGVRKFFSRPAYTFKWNSPYEFFSSIWFFSSDFWSSPRQTHRRTDRQKATPNSPPCLSTGGLKILPLAACSTCISSSWKLIRSGVGGGGGGVVGGPWRGQGRVLGECFPTSERHATVLHGSS